MLETVRKSRAIMFAGLTALVVGSVLTWSGVARAGGEVVIRQVSVDLETEVIHISGTGFDAIQDTTVILGNHELAIEIESVSNIQASLAGTGIGPGNYLLEVIVNQGTSRSDEFDLTITAESSLQSQVDSLQDRVTALETLLAGITRSVNTTTGVDTLVFEGMNLQVVNGSGYTDWLDDDPFGGSAANGAGNIIIGYNDAFSGDLKSGSHNLVIGDAHTYTTTSGIVSGWDNELSGEFSAAIAGFDNSATGDQAAVIGGIENTASGTWSFVAGGNLNRATGDRQAIVGDVLIE